MTTTKPLPVPVLLPAARVDALPWADLPGSPGVRIKPICVVESTRAGLLQLAAGAVEPTHMHPDGEHHLWVLSGSLTVEGTHLSAGSYLHIPAGLRHHLQDDGSGCTLLYVHIGPPAG